MSKTKVVLRADRNSEIGLGHVVRSLALADMLKEDFECVFAIQNPDVQLRKQIESVCSNVIALPSCSHTAEDFIYELDAVVTGQEIVVLDGYTFTTDYQKHLKNVGCLLVCIDDIHACHFVADVIINHTPGMSKDQYSFEPYTQLYLGPEYALLRPPFLKTGRSNEFKKSVKNIFINMGGADPGNATGIVLNEIIKFDFFDAIHVVTGSAYKHQRELERIVTKDKRITGHTAISAGGMANLMQQCRVAVCPPSSVSFEYISSGGVLFLKQTADNQRQLRAYLVEHQIAFDYDQDFRRVMALNMEEEYNKALGKQLKFLDGYSDERLKSIFYKLDVSLSLSFQPALEDDLMTCYVWANDPEVRRWSYNSAAIPLDEHERWFTNKINSAGSAFYIIKYKSKSIGQIRFDGDKERVISYLIAPAMRGKGLGSIILKKGVHHLLKEVKGIKKISGYVKTSNIASCKAFEKAGFTQAVDPEIPYPDSVKYELLVSRQNSDVERSNLRILKVEH